MQRVLTVSMASLCLYCEFWTCYLCAVKSKIDSINPQSSMKSFLLLFAFLFHFVACKQEMATSEPVITKRTSWKNYGCELVTDHEVSQIFKFNPDSCTLNSRSLPDQVFCLRTWQKSDWKERESNNEKEGAPYLNPSNRLVVQLFDYNSAVHAEQQMQMLRRDRRNTYEEDVPNLGDDALWSTNTVTLLVKKGQLVINVAVEHSDTPHENLTKAKEVAALILKKL